MCVQRRRRTDHFLSVKKCSSSAITHSLQLHILPNLHILCMVVCYVCTCQLLWIWSCVRIFWSGPAKWYLSFFCLGVFRPSLWRNSFLHQLTPHENNTNNKDVHKHISYTLQSTSTTFNIVILECHHQREIWATLEPECKAPLPVFIVRIIAVGVIVNLFAHWMGTWNNKYTLRLIYGARLQGLITFDKNCTAHLCISLIMLRFQNFLFAEACIISCTYAISCLANSIVRRSTHFPLSSVETANLWHGCTNGTITEWLVVEINSAFYLPCWFP